MFVCSNQERLIFKAPFSFQMSSWNGWSKCRLKSGTCGSGTQSRTRTITVQPYCSPNCPTTAENRDCIHSCCPVHCVMSQWSAWGACTASCGSGLCIHGPYFCEFFVDIVVSGHRLQKLPCFPCKFLSLRDYICHFLFRNLQIPFFSSAL